MIDAILFLTLAVTGSDDVTPEPTCVTAAWLMPGPWVEGQPSWPQDLIAFEPRACGDLTWPAPECGQSYQIDSYVADDITAALLVPGRVLYGPSDPQESLWEGSAAWAFIYGGDCVTTAPTPTPTETINPTPTPTPTETPTCDAYVDDLCVIVDPPPICLDGEEVSNNVCVPPDEACPEEIGCVIPESVPPIEELAYTGSEDVPLFLFGLLLLCVGVFTIAASQLSRAKNPDPQYKRTNN